MEEKLDTKEQPKREYRNNYRRTNNRTKDKENKPKMEKQISYITTLKNIMMVIKN